MKKIRKFIFLSLLLAIILFWILPINYAGDISNKWSALGFELVKLLLQLVVAGIVGKILVDNYNEGREKEKMSNQFRKDVVDGLLKAYHKTKRVRRILKGNIIVDNGIKKINHKVYEEQMHDIIDAQLAFEYYKSQLDYFPNNFKTNINPLKDEAGKLESYLGDLVSQYEELGGAGEFISLADPTNNLDGFLEKENFIPNFADYFHSSVKLIAKEIF